MQTVPQIPSFPNPQSFRSVQRQVLGDIGNHRSGPDETRSARFTIIHHQQLEGLGGAKSPLSPQAPHLHLLRQARVQERRWSCSLALPVVICTWDRLRLTANRDSWRHKISHPYSNGKCCTALGKNSELILICAHLAGPTALSEGVLPLIHLVWHNTWQRPIKVHKDASQLCLVLTVRKYRWC